MYLFNKEECVNNFTNYSIKCKGGDELLGKNIGYI